MSKKDENLEFSSRDLDDITVEKTEIDSTVGDFKKDYLDSLNNISRNNLDKSIIDIGNKDK